MDRSERGVGARSAVVVRNGVGVRLRGPGPVLAVCRVCTTEVRAHHAGPAVLPLVVAVGVFDCVPRETATEWRTGREGEQNVGG